MLEALLKQTIRAQGKLTVAQFMQHALLHPQYGYYTQRDPFGRDGDFITAPDVSQMFGEMIGVWCADRWQAMGSPASFALVEFGPGRGTLMKDCLRATRHVPGFHAALSVHLLEASPKLCAVQHQLLKTEHPRISWHMSLETIPLMPMLLVANEFFDALPIQQYVRTEHGWMERVLGVSPEDRLQFELAPTPLSPKLYERYPEATPSAVVEISPFMSAYVRWIAERVLAQKGAALIVDYGYSEPHFSPTLQAVKAHRYHDLLADIGSTDITAHVDFLELFTQATDQNISVYGPVPQGEWLCGLGIETRAEQLQLHASDSQREAILSGLHRLIDAEEMGELFKVIEFSKRA